MIIKTQEKYEKQVAELWNQHYSNQKDFSEAVNKLLKEQEEELRDKFEEVLKGIIKTIEYRKDKQHLGTVTRIYSYVNKALSLQDNHNHHTNNNLLNSNVEDKGSNICKQWFCLVCKEDIDENGTCQCMRNDEVKS